MADTLRGRPARSAPAIHGRRRSATPFPADVSSRRRRCVRQLSRFSASLSGSSTTACHIALMASLRLHTPDVFGGTLWEGKSAAWFPATGPSTAMDGRRRAHRDVLAACPVAGNHAALATKPEKTKAATLDPHAISPPPRSAPPREYPSPPSQRQRSPACPSSPSAESCRHSVPHQPPGRGRYPWFA
ncbi:hypothetical protein EV688_1115 [Chromatocurvus halotolerans]|uniref:Uncharacterized protein n=1 Tax=Chromatocurvus halotolerans TaxID=1132028 RepID=A0A4R2KX84_9GAMM|nr:hypothetical protein EV688_1115 [Chromatocurvus halotolerans]